MRILSIVESLLEIHFKANETECSELEMHYVKML